MNNAPPSRLVSALQLIAEALRELDRPFALVGGLAVSARSEPRFTRDIDLAVAVSSDLVAEGLIADLVARGFRLRLSLEQDVIGRLAAVRLSPPGEPEDGVVLDLLFASSGIEAEICDGAESLEIAPGLHVPVALTGDLIAMKLLSRSHERPQDDLDIKLLLAVASSDERERARGAVDRIERLGTNRGRAIRRELDAMLSQQ
jgi:predicted nucleotidyltransferase